MPLTISQGQSGSLDALRAFGDRHADKAGTLHLGRDAVVLYAGDAAVRNGALAAKVGQSIAGLAQDRVATARVALYNAIANDFGEEVAAALVSTTHAESFFGAPEDGDEFDTLGNLSAFAAEMQKAAAALKDRMDGGAPPPVAAHDPLADADDDAASILSGPPDRPEDDDDLEARLARLRGDSDAHLPPAHDDDLAQRLAALKRDAAGPAPKPDASPDPPAKPGPAPTFAAPWTIADRLLGSGAHVPKLDMAQEAQDLSDLQEAARQSVQGGKAGSRDPLEDAAAMLMQDRLDTLKREDFTGFADELAAIRADYDKTVRANGRAGRTQKYAHRQSNNAMADKFLYCLDEAKMGRSWGKLLGAARPNNEIRGLTQQDKRAIRLAIRQSFRDFPGVLVGGSRQEQLQDKLAAFAAHRYLAEKTGP